MRHIVRAMDNVLIQRINQRLAIVGKSAQRVSVEATGAKETLRKILDGTTKSPRIDTLLKIAAALDTSVEWLMGQTEDPAPTATTKPIASDVRSAELPLPGRSEMPKDVPVLGTAAGSHLRGAFQLSSDPIDYVRRPPALVGTKDIYSLYVEGSSMEPQFWPGDLVYIHPHKPARIGDAVVVQCRNGTEGTLEATIGIYLRRTAEVLVIRKHNPPAEVEIKRDIILAHHKVLTLNELFGV